MTIWIVIECHTNNEYPMITSTAFTQYNNANLMFIRLIKEVDKNITPNNINKAINDQVYNSRKATFMIHDKNIYFS